MRTFIAMMLCSSVAFGDPPKDAPTCDTLPRGRSMLIGPGEIVPFRSICVDEPEMVRRECINERNVGELVDAHLSWLMPKPMFVGLISLASVLSAAIAVGFTMLGLEVSKPKPNP